MNEVHFSSERRDWRTPPGVFQRLDAEFGFKLDAAATAENALCERFWTEADDGLSKPWDGPTFVNPPYGRGIWKWVEKAFREGQRGVVVMLIPARTDTRYWHDYVMEGAEEVRLVAGRLNFGGDRESGHNAPFPCAIVVFRPGTWRPPEFSTFERDAPL
jgi:phage N-6-adenine-methyltransferase